MNNPFAAINAATLQAEASRHRSIAKSWCAAVALAAAALILAHMGLTTALALPDIVARAAAERAM